MFNVIPVEVCGDNNLVPGAILLYGNVCTFTMNNRIVFASNKYFAKFYGVSPRTIQRWLENLRDHGYITIENKSYDDEGQQKEIRTIKPTPKGFNLEGTKSKEIMRGVAQDFYGSSLEDESKYRKTTMIKDLKRIWED